ncbi:MAG: sulfatase-like hydrolase/transferase [Acidobacteria bacterium]|nr:sulfatase-like hydrolase/transferase [Acidobacteriota bacterium]
MGNWLPKLLCVLLACPLLAQSRRPPQKPARPNVILITLDTVRADHLGCYGAKNIQTPTLDSLARDGVVFERAISQVPLTWPSHAAILTGTQPFQNGVQDFTGQPLEPRFRSVAQAFQHNGYATGAVVSAYVLDRSWGLIRGFDFYDDAFSADTFTKKDIGLVDRRAEESVTHALTWLKKRPPQRPFFFWLHLYDPHSPYDPPEPFRSQYREHPYAGEIAYADHELGRLVTWLKQSQLYDRTLIVFLSDHGESLGQHGEAEHGFFVYNSTVHIPLIVKPAKLLAGRGISPTRVARPVETTAVAPTLLASAGIHDEIEQQFTGRGLFTKDAEATGEAYSETFYPFSSFGWSPLHALQTSRYHFIDAPEPELYDLTADPGEEHNLAKEQTATVAVLKEKLQKRLQEKPHHAAGAESSGLTPEALEKLRALGYVAYRAPVSPEALAAGLPDPKSKLWEFNAILKAGDAFQAGDVAGGKALLDKVRDGDPKMYIVPFMLGENALRRREWDEAATELQKCLELNPNFDQAMAGLARALVNLDRAAEAKAWLDKALQFNPQNYRAWYERGFIESKSNPPAAIADMEKAVAIQPNFASLRRDLGMLQFQQQNYGEAAKHLAKAAELGLRQAQLFNFLGICYSRTGELKKALASYTQALKLDPNLAQAHLNLGFVYQRLNDPANARKEYSTACRLDQKLCQYVNH